MLITIVELPEYIKRVEKILSEDERDDLLYYLSSNPKAGNLMKGTGGVRKLRWASKGKGKSGGSRVIYFFYNETIPCYVKSQVKKRTINLVNHFLPLNIFQMNF